MKLAGILFKLCPESERLFRHMSVYVSDGFLTAETLAERGWAQREGNPSVFHHSDGREVVIHDWTIVVAVFYRPEEEPKKTTLTLKQAQVLSLLRGDLYRAACKHAEREEKDCHPDRLRELGYWGNDNYGRPYPVLTELGERLLREFELAEYGLSLVGATEEQTEEPTEK